MTVKELILQLKEVDQDLQIRLESEYGSIAGLVELGVNNDKVVCVIY